MKYILFNNGSLFVEYTCINKNCSKCKTWDGLIMDQLLAVCWNGSLALAMKYIATVCEVYTLLCTTCRVEAT